jgi:hypothetical protein
MIMRDMIDPFVGCPLRVPDDRVDAFLEAGYRLVAEDKAEPVAEEPKPKPVRKKRAAKKTEA